MVNTSLLHSLPIQPPPKAFHNCFLPLEANYELLATCHTSLHLQEVPEGSNSRSVCPGRMGLDPSHMMGGGGMHVGPGHLMFDGRRGMGPGLGGLPPGARYDPIGERAHLVALPFPSPCFCIPLSYKEPVPAFQLISFAQAPRACKVSALTTFSGQGGRGNIPGSAWCCQSYCPPLVTCNSRASEASTPRDRCFFRLFVQGTKLSP